MLVKEFIEIYEKNKGEALEAVKDVCYLPFAKKRILIEKLKETCIDTTDGIAVADKMLLMTLIDIYAVEAYAKMDFGDAFIGGYDALMNLGAVDEITDAIGIDYCRFKSAAIMEINCAVDEKNDWRRVFVGNVDEAAASFANAFGTPSGEFAEKLCGPLRGNVEIINT